MRSGAAGSGPSDRCACADVRGDTWINRRASIEAEL